MPSYSTTAFLKTAITIMFVIASTCSESAASEPHPHQGKVTPFQAGDPKVELSQEALAILKDGKPYQTQIQNGSTGRGLVVQDIRAPTNVVWGRILDYNHYAKMVPKTIESENYEVIRHKEEEEEEDVVNDNNVGVENNNNTNDNNEDNENVKVEKKTKSKNQDQGEGSVKKVEHSNTNNIDSSSDDDDVVDDNDDDIINQRQTIYTRMKVGFPMIKLQFFVKHEYYPKLNSLTWTLDYTKRSDFDDSCGFWYVVPHEDNPTEWTRVYYSVEVSMFDWVPKFVVNFMSQQALTEATGWVKKFSEQEYAKIQQDATDQDNLQRIKEENRRKQQSQQEQKPKKKFFGRLLGIFRKRNNTEDINISDDQTACSADSNETCVSIEDDELSVDNGPIPLDLNTISRTGVVRYLLVLSVVILGIYNIYPYIAS